MNWDEKWPEIMLAVNSGVSESTGYSPAFVVQGREPRLPKALYDDEALGTGQGTPTPDENAAKLREVFQLVRRNLERAAQDQARYYNLRRRAWKPTIGDKVWAKQHHLSNAAEGFAAKLAPKYDGPYTIMDFVSPVICKLKKDSEKRTRTAHIGDLMPQPGEGTPKTGPGAEA
ncbi:uncharacterized protein LOC117193596 [Drosophila miranda]|uniref:uncharacterized protein LOC117193596 n=1 Tax=Drosophila miranda TaxID=7229 RepID=UPI00143F7D18|nr:uncharacterized protein LOC117193596 [Drosophila miranda]